MNRRQDMFSFGTKAVTLARLEGKLKYSTIPKFDYFTVSQWKSDQAKTLAALSSKLCSANVIVRSSALSEDDANAAKAGMYLSVPGIAIEDNKALREAIDAVISCYEEKVGDHNQDNQVMVQEMVVNPSMSGVVFTQELNTGAPYYVINYDDESGRTDAVTSGNEYANRTLLVHRGSRNELCSDRFRRLLKAVDEIESVVASDCLDIEFAEDESGVVRLFQVRRITTQPNWNRGITLAVNDAIERLRPAAQVFLGPKPGLNGRRSILGRMPDWNPAEMIGPKPRPLSLSLYRHLITDKTWRRARGAMGYAEPHGVPLLLTLMGQPFIDVRASFNSLLPRQLDPEVANSLVDKFVDRLATHPHLHDKVEFDVAITALNFDFDEKIDAQVENALDNEQLTAFRAALRQLTDDLVCGRVATIQQQLARIDQLDARREAFLERCPKPDLALASALLEDCIEFGTLPFSILARHAFIARGFLRSLVTRGILSEAEEDGFFRSLTTVSGQFIADLERFAAGEIDRPQLMRHYGHLRPGTYDILSIRYDQRQDIADLPALAAGSEIDCPSFVLSDGQATQIDRLAVEFGFGFSSSDLFQYIEEATKAREFAKFVFSRNISDALEAISAWGEANGLSNDELSFLEIHTILDSEAAAIGRTLEDHLREISERGRRQHAITEALRLPNIITQPTDLTIVPLGVDCPNFITSKICRGPAMLISGGEINAKQLDQRIILIESADPGFDWIFARPIKGLITRFGGSNSHMAIRCAEFGLPAAIGCGEQIFERLIQSRVIELNCADGRIVPLDS